MTVKLVCGVLLAFLIVPTLMAASAPPTVATPASASPSPVIANSTALSILGADDGGEANLIYSWSVTGPAPLPTFSVNASHAAQNTTATFTKAGTYVFTGKITDAQTQSVTSAVTVVVQQTPTTITVTPATATINPAATQQYAATVVDQFGAAISGRTYTWAISAGGTITTAGNVTAITSGGPYTVTASTGGVNGTASLRVNTPPVAQNNSLGATNYNTPVAILVVATDAESDPLTYSISTPLPNGTVTGTGPNYTYTPKATFSGTDTFKYKVYDGRAYSNIATVTITVQAKLVLTLSATTLPLKKGASGVVSAVLTSQPIVQLTVTVANTIVNSDVLSAPSTLTFTPADWNVPHPVLIQSINSVQVQPASNTFSFKGLAFSTVNLTVTITDPTVQSNNSILAKGDTFDATKFQNDPVYKATYLSALIPSRVHQMATPGATVPVLRAAGPNILALPAFSGGLLSVVGAPASPITFYVVDDGMFLGTHSNCVTVLADASGNANVTFNPTTAGTRSTILVASPMSSGQVRFLVKSTP